MNLIINETGKAIFLLIKSKDDSQEKYVSLDYAGRILWWTENGRFFRRGFDNNVVEYSSGNNGFRNVRFSRLLEKPEAETRLKDLIPLLPLKRIPETTWKSITNDSDNFRSLYGGFGVPILPPDQYMSLVLQATEGCNWNRCIFCNFYKSRHFRAKSLNEFKSHVKAVKGYFGHSLLLRTGIFIGDANMLCLPRATLLEMLEFVNSEIDLVRHTGKNISGFAETRGSQFLTVEDFRLLRERRVKRLYWGLETGDEELRRLLGKPSPVDALRSAMAASKTAGINIGVMILLGPGGEEWSDKHVANTIKAINTLPLGKGDIVYLSKLTGRYLPKFNSNVIPEGFNREPKRMGAEELDDSGMEKQRRDICESICRHDRPIIATYDVEGFIY